VIHESKAFIRAMLLNKIKGLSNSVVLNKSKAIQNKFWGARFIEKSSKIGLYYSKDNEVSTHKLVESLLYDGKQVFLPKVEGIQLFFRKITSLSDLELGAFNVLEPKKTLPIIDPKDLDLLIIPCIAIDKSGNRIGYGKGFYDRFLSKYLGPIVCLGYDFQIVKKIIPEKHDYRVDFVVTDKRIICANKCKLLLGRRFAEEVLLKIKKDIKKIKLKPGLAVILVGNDKASLCYVKIKQKKCEEVGINFKLFHFLEDQDSDSIKKIIVKLNKDLNVSGIIVQLPLPNHLDTNKIINLIDSKKDVDGLTNQNRNNFLNNKRNFSCCTPAAILKLLLKNKISLKNKKIVVVGRGNLVGYPLSLVLKKKKIKFKVCTQKTLDLKKETRDVDILISATGKPFLIRKDFIKEGCVVVDAGTSYFENRFVGDVKFDEVRLRASYLTPEVGGVGPLTVAILLQNVFKAAFWFSKVKNEV